MLQHVVYINLQTRQDRRSHIIRQLTQLGLVGMRFNAIRHTVGAIGCFCSHLEVLYIAKRRNWSHVCIIEDDAVFTNPSLFNQQLKLFFALHSSREWDVLLLGGNHIIPYIPIDATCGKVQKCYSSVAYIVPQHYFDCMISHLQEGLNLYMNHPIEQHQYALDVWWTQLQEKDRWLTLLPRMVTQLVGYSDIEEKKVNYTSLLLGKKRE